MTYIIGLLIIVPAIYTFIKYKPKNKDVWMMFIVNVGFGAMVTVSMLSFDSAKHAFLSCICILGLLVMNFCFYSELAQELIDRKAARAKKLRARAKARDMHHQENAGSSEQISFVA